MTVLRLSLRPAKGNDLVIICICRGKSDRDIDRAIGHGAATVRDLQRCGIGDQCGSCHISLRGLLARAETAHAACHGELLSVPPAQLLGSSMLE